MRERLLYLAVFVGLLSSSFNFADARHWHRIAEEQRAASQQWERMYQAAEARCGESDPARVPLRMPDGTWQEFGCHHGTWDGEGCR